MNRQRPRPRRPKQKPEIGALFRQPGKGFYAMPELEVRGGCVLTDGCRRVLDFSPKRLCLDMGGTIITFYGQDLRIESLAGKRLVVAGKVQRMDFTQKWEGEDGL